MIDYEELIVSLNDNNLDIIITPINGRIQLMVLDIQTKSRVESVIEDSLERAIAKMIKNLSYYKETLQDVLMNNKL